MNGSPVNSARSRELPASPSPEFRALMELIVLGASPVRSPLPRIELPISGLGRLITGVRQKTFALRDLPLRKEAPPSSQNTSPSPRPLPPSPPPPASLRGQLRVLNVHVSRRLLAVL